MSISQLGVLMKKGNLYLCTDETQLGDFKFKPGDVFLAMKVVNEGVIIFTKGSVFYPDPQYTFICSLRFVNVPPETFVLISELEEVEQWPLPENSWSRQGNHVIMRIEKTTDELGPHMEFLGSRNGARNTYYCS